MLIYIRGGGDLSSGVAYRLHKCGYNLIISELPQPVPVRRTVSFASAIYQKEISIEGLTGILTTDINNIPQLLLAKMIPVIIDPEGATLPIVKPDVIVDGRMLKQVVDLPVFKPALLVGLGPGFTAGINCDAVVETNRGPFLGRVYWNGQAEEDTGIPEPVNHFSSERVIRSPGDGVFTADKSIGDQVKKQEIVGYVNQMPVFAPIEGIVRGLIMDGLQVYNHMKIGDIDPRMDRRLLHQVSDKSLAICGGVLEAILTKFHDNFLTVVY